MLQRAHSPQRLDLSSSTSLVGAERKSRRRGCGVSERTTIEWNHFLTFRRFPAACCRELQKKSLGTRLGRKQNFMIENLISTVQRPSRYLGNEINVPQKDWAS